LLICIPSSLKIYSVSSGQVLTPADCRATWTAALDPKQTLQCSVTQLTRQLCGADRLIARTANTGKGTEKNGLMF
jgi:hypothetical protein